MKFVSSRLPSLPDLFRVFSLTIFLVYTWSVVTFFWNLPRFLLFLSMGEIAAVAAYSLTLALADSALIAALTALLACLLPPGWMRDRFVPAGGAFASGLFFVSIASQSLSANLWLLDDVRLLLLGAATLALLGLLVYAAARFPLLAAGLTALAQRTEIFFYIYVPLTLPALLTVTLRNAGGP
jgi:hypothetical protein